MAFHLNVSEFETRIDIKLIVPFKNDKNCKLKIWTYRVLKLGNKRPLVESTIY